ncbi:MAG: FAD-dependent oxidoreductase [Janthinobacterium lividum]
MSQHVAQPPGPRASSASEVICDLLVIGSGAAGLSTAVTAKAHGLDVIVAEKEAVFGGTTAFSGGVLWVPGSGFGQAVQGNGEADSRAAVETYMKHEAGAFYDAAAVKTFLDNGPEMVEWFERETSVKFTPSALPDYHPDVPGGVNVGRSIMAKPFDIRALGQNMARLRRPLNTITFIGMMFNSSNEDLKHFFNATKSFKSFRYVLKRLTVHLLETAVYRRGIHVTSGNALAARLAKSAFDLDIPIWTSSPVKKLITEHHGVTGALVERDGATVRVTARRGVVLACGGFSQDVERIKKIYPHLRRGGEHLSPVPTSNTGDGTRLAESVGGKVDIRYDNASAWIPCSKVPLGGGRFGVFPHLQDRYKPGIIGVKRNGRRFTNEANSYHDVGAAMIAACEGEAETAMWLVCDHATLRKYGLGYAKPAPVPLGSYLRSGYLLKGRTLSELAAHAGLDAQALEQTVREFNEGARRGVDLQFGRGSTAFNRYLGDPAQQPNPNVAPIEKGPFYAVKVVVGDLGSFDGIKTSAVGEVIDDAGQVIHGLYAVGNDRASIMGGNYPGGGITLGPCMTFGYATAKRIAAAGVSLPAVARTPVGVELGAAAAADRETRV